jgi:Pectate lyase superfamily protein
MVTYTSAPVPGVVGASVSGTGSAPVSTGIINVLGYGAKGDGITDDTAAINSAIATGRTVYLPKANYLIKGQITCSTPGQIIYGDGKYQTIITINSTFNLAATGVFVVMTGEPGPQFRDFYINFTQPITNVRGNLIAYPPAFYAQAQPRCSWHGIKINCAMIGIDIRENSGGSSIVLCEICAFTYHVAMDGSEDSIMIQNCRFEGDQIFTTQLYTIYINPATVGVYSGRSDDLHIDTCLFICGQAILTVPSIISPGDGTFGEISNCDFDSYAGIYQSDGGYLSMSACSFTSALSAVECIAQVSGTINLSSAWFFGSVSSTNGLIIMSVAAGKQAILNISTCRFNLVGNGLGIQLNSPGGGSTEINISNCRFDPDPALLVDFSCIGISSGCLITMMGCRFGGKTRSSNVALQIVADDKHNICSNSFNGWSTSLPAGYTQLVYANNN